MSNFWKSSADPGSRGQFVAADDKDFVILGVLIQSKSVMDDGWTDASTIAKTHEAFDAIARKKSCRF